MIKVAFSGYAGAGKTHAAKRLFQNLPEDRPVGTCPFASPIKELVYALWGEPDNKTLYARSLHQQVGAKMREIDPDVWVRMAETAIELAVADGRLSAIIVDDLRYPNEYDMLKRQGFTIVHISRPGLDTEGAMYEHESEQHVEWLAERADRTIVAESVKLLDAAVDDLTRYLEETYG